MRQLLVKSTRVIDAPAADIYALLADYRNGHPRILPQNFFHDLTVVEGGVGAGTVFTFDAVAGGRTQHMRYTVSEPEPGRVLMESDTESDLYTTFTCEPIGDGRQTQYTVVTMMSPKPGIFGQIEFRFTGAFLKRVYTQEIDILVKVMREDMAARAA